MALDRNMRYWSGGVHDPRAMEPRKLPKLIERIRDLALSELEQAFVRMMESADDALFDLADKSAGNRDQSLYFDAMRELRIKRKGMENVFRQELLNAFQKLAVSDLDLEASDVAAAFTLDNLTLVHEDELEENLAFDSMVTKARNRSEEALRFLARRFDAVVPDMQIELEQLPVAPKSVCEAFRNAGKALSLDMKARLVVFKLFERSVLTELPEIYDELNGFLAENGVLPDLHLPKPRKIRHAPDRAKSASVPSGDYPSSGADGGDEALDIKTEVFNALRDLLAVQKGHAVAMDGGLGAVSLPVVETPQLLNALSTLQHDPEQAAQLLNAQQLRQSLALRLPVVGRVDAQAVGSVNDDIIDIVSMLFDFILGDHNLGDEVKAQLGRLQIPMLKVALVDKTFFSNRNHAARLLLNEMAYAGIGWDQERRGRDGLQGKIESIVQRVLSEFEDDTRLFDGLLKEFREFVGEEKRRAAILEKRTREAEEGKARTEAARAATDAALVAAIGERSLPPVAARLLHEVWSKVLMLEHLRGGDDNENFQNSARVAQDLVRSVCVRSQAEKAQLPALLPGLVRRLRAGFESISFGAIEASALLHELERLHVMILRMPVPVEAPPVGAATEATSPAPQAQSPIPAATAEVSVSTEPALAGLALAAAAAPLRPLPNDLPPSAVPETPQAAPAPSAQETDLLAEMLPEPSAEDQALLSAFDIEPEARAVPAPRVETIVMETPAELRVQIAVADDATLAKVDALAVGAWVELRETDKPVRAKLAAKIPSVGKLIFVNRSGMKVAEFTRPGFALALMRESVKLLDDAALFDRALEAVIGNLRKLKDAADA